MVYDLHVGTYSCIYVPTHVCSYSSFLTVCAVFSVIGFIFSFCMASTVAAQSGALAGLGIAFVSKPIVFEVSSNALPRCPLQVCYTAKDTPVVC